MNGRVHIGRRIAALRMAHGDSLRQAAARTGVSHTTIARIENGTATTSFHSTLRKVAEGYGVSMEYLLTGRDPRQEFEQSIRRLPSHERSRLSFTSAANRTRMVLQFLRAEYPQEFPLELLAASLGTEATTLQHLLDEGEASHLSESTIRQLGEELARLTGISHHWFRSGYVGTDQAESMTAETFSAYIQLMKRAASAGVRPDVLEMAIDLLILKQRDSVPAGEAVSRATS